MYHTRLNAASAPTAAGASTRPVAQKSTARPSAGAARKRQEEKGGRHWHLHPFHPLPGKAGHAAGSGLHLLGSHQESHG